MGHVDFITDGDAQNEDSVVVVFFYLWTITHSSKG